MYLYDLKTNFTNIYKIYSTNKNFTGKLDSLTYYINFETTKKN